KSITFVQKRLNAKGVEEQILSSTVTKEVNRVEVDGKTIYNANFSLNYYTDSIIYAYVTDNLGRTSLETIASRENCNQIILKNWFLIEKTNPIIENLELTTNRKDAVVAKVNGKEVYNDDVKIEFSVSDIDGDNEKASGINSVKIKVNDKEIDESKNYVKENNDTLKYEDKFSFNTSRIDAGENGEYKVNIIVTDNAGNVSEEERTFYVDKTSPFITGFEFSLDKNIDVNSSNDKMYNAVEKYDYGFYFKKQVTVTVNAIDEVVSGEYRSGIAKIHYVAVATDGTKVLEGSKIPVNGKISFVINKDFKGQIYAYAEDNVKNTLANPNSKLPKGVDKKVICEGNYAGYVHPNGTVIETQSKHLDTSDIEFVVPKSVGHQNNKFNYKYTGEGQRDDIMDYNTNGNVPLYDKDVTFGVKVSDTFSGIRSVKYVLYENNKVITQKIVEVTNEGVLKGDSEGCSVQIQNNTNLVRKITRNIVASGNFNDMILLVELTDRAGNVSYDYYAFGIDKTNPKINVSYDNNSGDSKSNGTSYFKADRVATITITERNFDKKGVVILNTKNKKNYKVDCSWSKIEGDSNHDNDKYVAKITYNENVDYTFDIKYTDLAKRSNNSVDYGKSVAPNKFTVDKIAPKITVNYNNNSVANSKYFNKNRTATITIDEHNFDSSRIDVDIKASKDGSSITAPAISSWSSHGDTHTATINYVADGDYKFDIKMKDKAGNNDSGASYVGAATKDFTIDTVIKEPEITGVQNGHSYKNELVPVIKINDINYSTYSIKLTKTVRNVIDKDVTKQYIVTPAASSHGFTITNDKFDTVQGNDGIYVLKVGYTDKAGNSSSKTIKFTVNRFGSVYEYSKDLIDLNQKYVQKMDRNIVITEYNPNKLVENKTTVQITRDGSPISDVVYSVTPTVNNNVEIGESGWYEYKYNIDSSNFRKDGVYGILITSEDSVGNKPQTTNYDDGKVTFYVDTVAPEITSVKGLEKAIINADKLEVDYEIFDSIGIKSVKIFKDDKQVKTIDSFDDFINYTGEFEVEEGMNQSIRLVVEDKAGNITDTDSNNFKPKYKFNN
ncbi:MAG: Ig-like domain repeat protein, partial [Lachnospiraceae bacterium]|nr:Ig-like domain repeat protein [Lachnospiraceae bacterium]